MLTRHCNGHIKKLHRMAQNLELDLWYEDECHFQQHGSRCAMWVPPEDTDPVVLHAPTRKSIGVFGAVSNTSGRLVTLLNEKFDTASFLFFLQQLLRHKSSGKLMIVIVDNARWHHAKILQPWLREHRDRIRLDFLPPYSPELNPVERVWKLTRRLCTHNRYFPDLEDLIDVVSTQFEIWRKPNNTLYRLCACN
ncbi:MAG TPA: IS630 family transposase [Bacteroidetes bacterium]|nr:IS630 family transposase [Bacteroidota bacterium]